MRFLHAMIRVLDLPAKLYVKLLQRGAALPPAEPRRSAPNVGTW